MKKAFPNPGVTNLRALSGLTLCLIGISIGVSAANRKAGEQAQPVSHAPFLARWSTRVPMPFAIAQPLRSTFDWVSSFGGALSEQRQLERTAPARAPMASAALTRTLPPFVSAAVNPNVSARVSDLPADVPYTISSGQRPEGELTNREPRSSTNPSEKDSVVQRTAAAAAMPATSSSFEGMNNESACNGCIPPDPTGAVGPNHYVQMVNSHFAIYAKNGTLLSAPKQINALWSIVPNTTCATHNNGDPIVIYDQVADRWLISQFTVQSGSENYAECIAISQTPDPTGAYWLYQFDESADTFHDYPHIGIWPDGYYMTTNLFPNSGLLFSSGAGAWAFERPKMLQGLPARYVYFDETPLATQTYTPGGQLPTSLEGKTLPPTGAPNYFVEVDNSNQINTPPATGLYDEMHIWQFHVDWNNPANSTFGTGSTNPTAKPGFAGQYAANAGQPNFIVPIANFVPVPCEFASGPQCIPQKLVSGQPVEYLEAVGDRLMYRVTYRNFGDHDSLVVSHTALVDTNTPEGVTRAGVRWYELRNLSATPIVYQQSTFAPLNPTDLNGPIWRWMGSAAMDHSGDIAIGYSASGPNYYPSLHYAGRLVSDPLNDLTQGEAVFFAGLGIESAVPDYLQRNRWGDYSTLTVDPSDDCTFWYTNEFINTNAPTDPVDSIHWRTRIASFKFPQCVSPSSIAVTKAVSRKMHGDGNTYDVDLPLTGGGIECRTGGTAGNHQIVATFPAPISFTDVSTTCGTVSGTSSAGNDLVINLTGVPNASSCAVVVNGINGGGASRIPVAFLLGDTNSDGSVNSADIGQTKSQSGQLLGLSNFREDVNIDGNINSADIGQVKAQSGTALP